MDREYIERLEKQVAKLDQELKADACMDPTDVTRCVMMWFYNLSAIKQVEAIFPGSHPSYQSEKVSLAMEGPTRFFGKLDRGNQRRLVEDAIARYGAGVLEDSKLANRPLKRVESGRLSHGDPSFNRTEREAGDR